MGRPGEGNRDGENVLCPLYVSFTDNEIRCQAHLPEANATIHRYANKAACRRQRNICCENCWERCEHYLAWKHFQWREEDDD